MTIPSLSHYRKAHPFKPSQQAANGALEIFVEGYRRDSPLQMLFGLSVLRDARAEQVDAAIAFLQAAGRAGGAEIRRMLAGQP